jgi:hypothetical protein
MDGWIEEIVRQVGHLPEMCRVYDDKVTVEQFFFFLPVAFIGFPREMSFEDSTILVLYLFNKVIFSLTQPFGNRIQILGDMFRHDILKPY